MTGVTAWWSGLSDADRARWHGVALCTVLFLVHFTLYTTWFIEDAAISFAFARNAALGEGLVAYPGGEPVEGFSNPSWTLLLAATRLYGVSPFISAKLYGALFGALTLPLAFRWARRMMGAEAGLYPVAAPLLLAVSPQFVMWCASGLENSLFMLLLAAGGVAMLEEVDGAPRPPWSALAFFGLAITRPEAPLYAAVAGVVGGSAILARHGSTRAWAWAWRWGALFLGPFAAFHALRIAYFAWGWPNTYYAKLAEDDRFQPLRWDTRGWKYLRTYALATGQGFLLPLYLLGQSGVRGLRGAVGATLAFVLVMMLVPGLEWPWDLAGVSTLDEPDLMVRIRVAAITLVAAVMPLVGRGRDGSAARALAWYLGVVAVFFALYSGGDWMDGFRWLSMGIVPMSVLFADAVRSLAAPLQRAAAPLTAVLLGTPLLIGAVRSGHRIGLPETSPYDVGVRVAYVDRLADRVHVDRGTQMDVDMGAHLWWSRFEVVDMAGLIDVPMGHHSWEKPFVRQYVFKERQPDFAHVHGGWASKTRMDSHREFRQYVEVDGYPVGRRSQHVGNHIHERHLKSRRWQGDKTRKVSFEGALRLEGLETPAAEVAAGQSLYVELGWARASVVPPFRAWAFLSDGDRVVAWELAPAYDWVPVSQWGRNEAMLGRHSLPLPDDLAPGAWDLGMVVVGEGSDQGVLPPRRLPAGATTADPRFVDGEVRWPGAVQVVALEVAEARAEEALAAALALASDDDCGGAEEAWDVGRRHLSAKHPWQRGALDRLSTPVARCYAGWAEALGPDGVEAISAARAWDHRDARVRAVGRTIADVLVRRGDVLWGDGQDTAAYVAWRDALRADPRRTWVRRRAEAARDLALERE